MRNIFIFALWAMLLIAVSLVAQQAPAPAPGQAKGEERKQDPPVAEVDVSGEVVDRDGKPLDKVLVTFTGKATTSKTTGPHGGFSVKLPPGKYSVNAKSGAKSKTEQINVGSEGLKKLSLTLE